MLKLTILKINLRGKNLGGALETQILMITVVKFINLTSILIILTIIIACTIFYFTGRELFKISVNKKCNKRKFMPRSLNFDKNSMKPEDLLECKFPLFFTLEMYRLRI